MKLGADLHPCNKTPQILLNFSQGQMSHAATQHCYFNSEITDLKIWPGPDRYLYNVSEKFEIEVPNLWPWVDSTWWTGRYVRQSARSPSGSSAAAPASFWRSSWPHSGSTPLPMPWWSGSACTQWLHPPEYQKHRGRASHTHREPGNVLSPERSVKFLQGITMLKIWEWLMMSGAESTRLRTNEHLTWCLKDN